MYITCIIGVTKDYTFVGNSIELEKSIDHFKPVKIQFMSYPIATSTGAD